MRITLKLTRVGMNMQEATVVEWFKKPGDKLIGGDPLYSIETDKVVHEVNATSSGTLIEILAQSGEDVTVGSGICVIETGG